MTATYANLVAAQNVPIAQTTAHTADSGGQGELIDKAVFVNYSGAAATLSVSIVPPGGSVLGQNTPIKTVSIAAGATYLAPEIVGKFIPPGGFISWIASVASSIGGEISGRKLT